MGTRLVPLGVAVGLAAPPAHAVIIFPVFYFLFTIF